MSTEMLTVEQALMDPRFEDLGWAIQSGDTSRNPADPYPIMLGCWESDSNVPLWCRSNAAVLQRDFPGFVAVLEDSGEDGLSLGLPTHEALPVALLRMVARLTEDPILDRENLQGMEEELAEQAWTQWGEAALRRELIEAGSGDLSHVSKDTLKSLWVSVTVDAGYPRADNATDVTLWDEEAVQNMLPVLWQAKTARS